ncbi:protoporphyrinogen oxidase [Salipaludibacillus aurantiacus]|uniref:Coproporphyrinogen III oxidase n=1 Tax=Salipaludibacillus aurantiacus TaxID=1601833 RepID=A0A1H9RLB1_9BACI|nr:protoporphyrinogen oxidase [Salipaludibacillus aurantiacus]SER73540.1 oxygen-dependent protoporphyrinogen oxidase [Salipaludibacillus aurantiacus]
MPKQRIAVIGGGMTGLSAAFYLQKKIKEDNLDAEFVLYEAKDKLGGRIETDYTDGFIIEQGPDSFLARKTSMTKLARELGMEDELIDNKSGSFILHNNKLYPMPEGAVMGIPTQWMPFIKTGLFSPAGKARAAMDLVIPRTAEGDDDQSLGRFFRKRLGNEVVDHLIEPLLSGIYAGDIDRLSLKATFPQFRQIEAKYRSLIVGMKTSMAKRQSASPSSNEPEKKPSGMFLTFKSGLQSLVDRMEEHLDNENVQKGKALTEIKNEDERCRLIFSDGTEDTVDKVILTTPHQHAYELFNGHGFMKPLGDMPSTSVATIALAYPKKAVKKDIDGTGFVVSKKSDYTITACTWTHKKWEHAAPEDYALLRVYVGKAGDDAIVDQPDETILAKVKEDINHIMDIEGEPHFYRIKRWKESMPQYEVGHVEKLHYVKTKLAEHYPQVTLTGASYHGIGLPDCVDQGKKAVEDILTGGN